MDEKMQAMHKVTRLKPKAGEKSRRIADSLYRYWAISWLTIRLHSSLPGRILAAANRFVSSKASYKSVGVHGSCSTAARCPSRTRQWHLFSTHAYVLLQQTPKYLDSNFTLVPWELKNWCNSFKHPHLWPFWIMHEELCQKNQNSCPPWINTLCVQLSNLITHQTKTCFSGETGCHFHLDPRLILSAGTL